MDDSKSEKVLFEEAASLYRTKQFQECEQTLKKLLEIKPDNSKLLANKALLDFVCMNEPKNITGFLTELQRLASVEHIDLPFDREPTVGSNKINSAPMKSHSNSPSPDPLKSYLPPSSLALTIRYNFALILYHQRSYLKAEQLVAACLGVQSAIPGVMKSDTLIFDRSFSMSSFSVPSLNLTPSLDVTLCRRLVLLWLEILLRLQLAERVYELSGSWLSLLSSIEVANTIGASVSSGLERPPGTRYVVTQTANMLHGVRKPIQVFYIRSCLLTGRLDSAECELNKIHVTPDLQPSSTLNSDEPNGNTACEDVSASAWDVGQSISFLRAHLSYLKNNHSNALHQLAKIGAVRTYDPSDSQCCLRHLVFNNCALVHHRSGQYTLGAVQLRRAIRELNSLLCMSSVHSHRPETNGLKMGQPSELSFNEQIPQSQLPLSLFRWTECHEMWYNFAISLLFARKPQAAFQLLMQLVRTYPRNPRLWLRVAECCFRVNKPDNLSAWQLEEKTRCVLEAVGVGPCRTLMFATTDQTPSISSDEVGSTPKPTIEFASFCLRNALLLLPRIPDKIGNDANPHANSDSDRRAALLKWADDQSVPVLPSAAALRGLGLLHLISSVHLCIAYVALCLNNSIDTLHSAPMLLAEPTYEPKTDTDLEGVATDVESRATVSRKGSILSLVAPPLHGLLARLYYAEALTCFDRVSEAVCVLQSCVPDSLKGDQLLKFLCSSTPCSLSNRVHPPTNNIAEGKQQASTAEAQCQQTKEAFTVGIDHHNFPATNLQAAGLLLYNLAVVLAVDKQWSAAEEFLHLSLSGLSVPVDELDGRKRSRTSEIEAITALPLPAISLQIYLCMALHKPEQALTVLRDAFGHLALAGRLNCPSIASPVVSAVESNTAEKERTWTISELRQLLKGAPQAQLPTSIRPSNLWAPPSQPAHKSHSTQPGLLPGLQQPQPMGGRWNHPPPPTSKQPYTTGLITAANENDWPPL